MEQRIRESLTLVLLAVLPFHAFLVTVGTKLIAGAGHAPLPILALWKEVLLAVILLLACIEIARNVKDKWQRNWDVIDACIVALLLLSIVLLTTHSSLLTQYLFGFKYDFVPLVAFLILRRVPWSLWFQSRAVVVLLAVAALVSLYGIATVFFPMSWFTTLGYSDLHSLYLPGGPLAAFQQIEGVGLRRIQSTFSGPNQLGLWLLVPLGVLLCGQRTGGKGQRIRTFIVGVLLFGTLLLTFSRSAWIAAGVMTAVALWIRGRRKVVIAGGIALLVLMLFVGMLFPAVIGRFASSRDHLLRPLAAIQTMIVHPFGLGLGSAGPASNRFSDTCVQLPKDSDWSWAQDRQNLCVFVDGLQVQPIDHTCSCPLLTENWYLQIGVELGWIGMLLYVFLLLFIFRHLHIAHRLPINNATTHYSLLTTHYSFLGLSIAALFLHAFEDSAVAYTIWILLATTLSVFSEGVRRHGG